MNALKAVGRRLVAAVLLVLVSPLILFAMVLVRIDSGGRMIFKQMRIGKNAKVFTIYKLRTMTAKQNAEKDFLFLDKGAFVTRIGSILRVLKIDEFPQLINVIKGQMGFLGPRPLREKLHRYYMEQIPGFEARYEVLPGMTGLAQLMDPEDEDRAFGLACDLYYIRHRSFKLDLAILGFTGLYVLHSILKHASAAVRQRFYKRVAGDFPAHRNFDAIRAGRTVFR